MKKHQIFMMLIAIWLAIIIPACRQKILIAVQEENPVIVDPPRGDRTVFTNWEEIELTYTVRWLDGYVPLFERAEPENMSFGEFELDPIRGRKLERRNRRKYKKENYEDLVYRLRYINEKKGDVDIPEQDFQYVKEEGGKPRGGLETVSIKAPGIILRYDSVLTKDADDIMDRIDFGSFKKQEYLWNGAIGGLALIMAAIFFMLFRKPAIVARKTNKTKAAFAGRAIDEQEERLAPKYALISLNNKLFRLQTGLAGNPDNQKEYETRAAVCNELRRFFLSYVPDLEVSEFSCEEIKIKISRIFEKRKRELLTVLVNCLEHHENILYREETKNEPIDKIVHISPKLRIDEIITTRERVDDLNDWKIWLFNKRQGWQRLSKRLKGFFRRAKWTS